MGCCGQNSNQPVAAASDQQPSPGTILNRRTRKYVSLHQSLVDAVPDGGWTVSTVMKGLPLMIRGTSPVDAMAQTREAFFMNKEPFNELRFWIEANIQWVENTNSRHHLVSAADLMAMRERNAPAAAGARPAAHPPDQWGSAAWRFLGLLLAKDSYDPSELTAVMRLVTDMLNPSTNPRLGCAECHVKASGMLNELVHNPPVDLSAARIWLVRKHNIVNARLGKPQLQMSEAASLNFWD